MTENSHVIVKSTGIKYPYSQFIENASKVKVPELKKEISEWGGYLLNRVVFKGESDGELQINTTTSSDQSSPSVGVMDNGDIIVTWTSDGQDGDGGGVVSMQIEMEPP